MRFKGYQGPRTKSGLPDRRFAAGRAAWTRSEAARRGWETRRQREEERDKHFPPKKYIGGEPGEETLVEEPIETVGGKRYGKKRR